MLSTMYKTEAVWIGMFLADFDVLSSIWQGVTKEDHHISILKIPDRDSITSKKQ
jgi:hypothetical protein